MNGQPWSSGRSPFKAMRHRSALADNKPPVAPGTDRTANADGALKTAAEPVPAPQ
ncbi:MAG: hypothetical protein M3552_01040 [Planctomycetota bacterium]|nr:hypothetical protein [Planctomycetota bacterium]